MKTLALLFAMTLAGAQVQAASKFAGDYLTILTSFPGGIPPMPGGDLTGAVNITIGSDGLVVGNGVFGGRTPISFTGTVNDAGQIILYEGKSNFVGYFKPSGKEFSIADPESTITGFKLTRKFPQAGVYHVRTGSKEKVLLLIYQDHSVHGTIYRPDHTSTALEGTATSGGFSAESFAGAIFKGKFDGTAISGTFITPAGGKGTLSGAKY